MPLFDNVVDAQAWNDKKRRKREIDASIFPNDKLRVVPTHHQAVAARNGNILTFHPTDVIEDPQRIDLMEDLGVEFRVLSRVTGKKTKRELEDDIATLTARCVDAESKNAELEAKLSTYPADGENADESLRNQVIELKSQLMLLQADLRDRDEMLAAERDAAEATQLLPKDPSPQEILLPTTRPSDQGPPAAAVVQTADGKEPPGPTTAWQPSDG